MGILKFFKKKKPQLEEDIIKASLWMLKALTHSGYKLDYSIESLKEIDRFLDEYSENGQIKSDSVLSKSTGAKLFALGSYTGEVIRRQSGGKWSTDDNDPNGEMNIAVILGDGSKIWPVQRVMKRLQEGSEEGIYIYGYVMMNHDSQNEPM